MGERKGRGGVVSFGDRGKGRLEDGIGWRGCEEEKRIGSGTEGKKEGRMTRRKGSKNQGNGKGEKEGRGGAKDERKKEEVRGNGKRWERENE